MLRIKRLAAADAAPVWSQVRPALASLMGTLALSPEDKSLIANCESDGDYLNFVTPLSGTLREAPILEGKPLFFKGQEVAELNFEERSAKWLAALQPYLPQDQSVSLDDPNLSPEARAALVLKTLVQQPQYLSVLEDKDPIIVPFWDHNFTIKPVVPPVAPAAAAATAVGGRRWWPWLLLLALLLGLAALWLLWGQHWWDERQAAAQRSDDLAALKQELVQRQYQLHDINRMLGRVNTSIDTALEHQRQKDLTALYRELEERRTNYVDIHNLLNQVADKEALHQAATEPVVPTEPSASTEPTEPSASTEPTASGVEPTTPAAPSGQVTAGQSKLPKCTTIIAQGKMPQLILATDGSGSMLDFMPDGSLRIQAAIDAAFEVVSSVDHNVPIRLFGMQGCPLARDYGTFSGNNRAALQRAIAQTNPLLSPRPLQVLTPLVSALKGMANVAGTNNDAVGILISDGLDTCNNTRNTDLCSLAREIHAAKPKLKINVVLIGDEAASARCIAQITGGKVYRPENAHELVKSLKQAAQSLVKVCN